MKIKLYHCAETRSMRTLWLLHELGIEFEVECIGFGKNLRGAHYLAKSPAGRVPALEIADQVLFETGAITEYLVETFPDAGLGRPAGHAERADWLIWLHFSETISNHSAALTQQHIMLYEDSMRSPIIMKLEAKRLEKTFAAVDARLAGRGMLLDGGFSAADISVGQAIYMSRHFAPIEPFAALSEWYGEITSRPAFVAALPQPDEARLYARDFYPPWEPPVG